MATHKTFAELAREMERYERRIQRGTVRAIKKVAMVIGTTLVTMTPVDTGRARSNWLTTIDVPSDLTIEEIREPATVLDHMQRGVNRYRLGHTIVHTNNLPYIVALDQGSSAQAPSGMSSAALAAGRAAARNLKILEGKRLVGGGLSGIPGFEA